MLTISGPDNSQRSTSSLEQGVRMLERGLAILLGLLTITILAGAAFLMIKMDSGSRSQGGRFYVAIVALVLLGVVDSQFRRLVVRRIPFSLTTTSEERRYSMVSLFLMLVSALVLIVLAWLLP